MTNPNKANQHTPDPRQEVCWEFYIESINSGRPNAYESAIKAGYEKTTATQITVISWFKEKLKGLKHKEMVSKAEKVLERTLDYNPETEKGIDSALLRVQTDVAKYLTSTLAKEDFSSRSELVGKDGKDLLPVPILGGISRDKE